jgi:hypothetical protein
MSYSRRQLEAFGEPLGDSVTRKEGGRVIYGGGGSGGGGGGTSTQVVDLPDWAKPTAQKQLGLAEATTDINRNPFQSFGGIKDAAGKQVGFDPSKVVAGMDPMQQQAYQRAGGMQTSPQLGTAMGLAGTAASRGLGMQYDPYATGQFGQQAGQYMDPYMQNVVNIQQREAQRQADIAGTQRGAQAVGAGAFGGSRQAIMDAEAARNLATQKGDIQARGLQDAYGRGQQQFNTEQQLREQSRQYGAGLGLQGLQTALQGAGQLGALGQQQFGQERDILNLQNQFGGQQQAQQQALINAEAQNFAAQQRYPYQQLEFMSNILRGTPMGTVQSMYQAPPSPLSQVVGAGTALYGASTLNRKEGGVTSSYAKGGSVSDAKVKREKKKSAGLAELALSKI